ncbi:MAG: glycosyltransferase [Planctomycetia bacterium]|nr:glycosyltransferase [Planctomycetia bacterium]
MKANKNIIVSVFMVTYNHGKYISQTLSSILMQKVDFNYEIVIGEDFSTDNTRTIVKSYAKKYPDKFNLLLHKKNIGMINNFFATYKACTGKYIAYCDGDDYWTDPNKLQKQVDFLETHPDYGLVHCNFDKLFYRTGKIIHNAQKNSKLISSSKIDTFNGLLTNQYQIATLTVLARTELLNKALNNANISEYMMLDLPMWLEMAQLTKFHYIRESVGVYRKVHGSASNDRSTYRAFIESGRRIRLDFANKYSTPIELKNKLQRAYLKSLLLDAFYSKNQQLGTQYYNYMRESNLVLNPLDRLIYLSIENKILYAILSSFDKIKNVTIFIIKYIVRRNV